MVWGLCPIRVTCIRKLGGAPGGVRFASGRSEACVLNRACVRMGACVLNWRPGGLRAHSRWCSTAEPPGFGKNAAGAPAGARETSQSHMPSTHLSLNYHLIFSTKHRETWIAASWGDRLHEYMGGIIKGLKGVPLAVGGISDHVHLLIGLRATHGIAVVLRELKSESSRWVHDTIGVPGFAWQEGYAAITVSPSQIEDVREYVLTQEAHHRTRTFQEEYREFLEKCGIAFDERFLW